MISLLRILILLLLLSTFAAQAPTVPVPTMRGYVTDPGHRLNHATHAELAQRLAEVWQKTGVRTGVLIVNTTGSESIEHYADRVSHIWKLDRDGLVLVVAWQDRNVRIQIGEILRDYYTASDAQWGIHHTLVPAFKVGDLEKGLLSSATSIGALLERRLADENLPPAFLRGFSPWKAVVVLCLVALCLLAAKRIIALMLLVLMPFPLALLMLMFCFSYPWLVPFLVWSARVPFLMFAVLVLARLLIMLLYKAQGHPVRWSSFFLAGSSATTAETWTSSDGNTYYVGKFVGSDNHSHSSDSTHSASDNSSSNDSGSTGSW